MSRHDPLIRLRHMLDHAREAVELIRGRTRDDLDRERMLELSLVRLVEIVGEAAAHLTRDEQARYPTIPWPQVTGMRNRLIHGYDTVDTRIVWEVIQDKLLPLERVSERLMAELDGSQ